VSRVLRKCVSMSTIASPDDDWGSLLYNPSLGFLPNLAFLGPTAQHGTNTRWVRLWADWVYHYPPTAQIAEPSNAFITNDQGQQSLNPKAMNASYVQAMDNNIAAAVAAGHPVILTLYRFPWWANGSVGLSDAHPTDQYDRTDQDHVHQSPTSWKSYFLRSPSDFSATSAWRSWITYICTRYNYFTPTPTLYGPAWVWGVEVVNEPNHQMWPQSAQSQTSDPWAVGSPLMGTTAVEMLATARDVTRRYGNAPVVMGPASDDSDEAPSRLITPFGKFTADVVHQVAQAGLWNEGPDPYLVWTHHNYDDIEKHLVDAQRGEVYPRVAEVIALLQNGGGYGGQYAWQGFPGRSSESAELWLTEGAARLTSISRLYANSQPLEINRPGLDQLQARLLEACYNAMSSSTPPWANVGMLTQFLTYSYVGDLSGGHLLGSPNTGGLLESPTSTYRPGQPRRAYWTWANFANPTG
jgi:hypothetical protein